MPLHTDQYIPRTMPMKLFIRSIWTLQDYHPMERTEVILPKGTVELIFNLSDQITCKCGDHSNNFVLPVCFLNGMNIQPVALGKYGRQHFIGLQLNTLGLKTLLGVSVDECMDAVVEGSECSKSLQRLSAKLCVEKNFQKQTAILLQWIEDRLQRAKKLEWVHRMHELFYKERTTPITVEGLHRIACVSERQLRRWSLVWTGLAPEDYLRYQKYLKALNNIHHTEHTLTDIGLMSGYYDQSHFIREFKRHAHLTPSQYRKHAKGQPGHLFV